MIDVQLVDKRRVPQEIDGFAVQRCGEVRIVARDDLTIWELAELINRLCADMTREAIFATYHWTATVTQ